MSISPISQAKSVTNPTDSSMLWVKRDSYDNKGISKLAMLPSQQSDFKESTTANAFAAFKSDEKGDKYGGKYNAWEDKGEQARARDESKR